MSKSSFFPHVTLCSRLNVCRITLIFGLCLVAYLFIYKIDINATATLARNILTPLSNLDQSNGQIVAQPLIPMTKSVGNIFIPDQKINKVVETTTTTTIPTNDTTTSQNSSIDQQPKEAFVTFSNNAPSYLAVLKVFLDSVHAFSTRPVIAFGIDVDLDIDTVKYPRVIKRRIKQSDCGPSVFFCKFYAIVHSNVDYGVLMETDDVVNYNVDVLFDVVRAWPYPLPISPRHPDDPQNYDHFMREFDVPRRTTPYIHAHVIWNYRALPFLKNLHSLLKQGHFQGSNFDETAVNVMLWKAGANHTVCKYDPYFTYSDAYEKWPDGQNCTKYCHTAFVTLHGCKEPKVSAALLTRLKANAGKPAIQTPGTGGMKHINDTSVTCCYPDSKPSPIHPLLCEHPPPK